LSAFTNYAAQTVRAEAINWIASIAEMDCVDAAHGGIANGILFE
jgi:hypothetical protein